MPSLNASDLSVVACRAAVSMKVTLLLLLLLLLILLLIKP